MTGPSTRERPLASQPRVVAAVAVGGGVGASLRYGLGEVFPTSAGAFPWTTVAINVGGSLLLGALLGFLVLAGTDHGWRRYLRVTLGTGMLGGFTTYSTFVMDITHQLVDARYLTAVVLAAGSVIAGVVAGGVGWVLGQSAWFALPGNARPSDNAMDSDGKEAL